MVSLSIFLLDKVRDGRYFYMVRIGTSSSLCVPAGMQREHLFCISELPLQGTNALAIRQKGEEFKSLIR